MLPKRFEAYNALIDDKDLDLSKPFRKQIKDAFIEKLMLSDIFKPDPNRHLTPPIPNVIASVPTAMIFEWEETDSGEIFIKNQYNVFLLSPYDTDVISIQEIVTDTSVKRLFDYKDTIINNINILKRNGFTDAKRRSLCEIFYNIFIRYTKRAFYGSAQDLATDICKNYSSLSRNYLGSKSNYSGVTDTISLDMSEPLNIWENLNDTMRDNLFGIIKYAKALDEKLPKELQTYIFKQRRLNGGLKAIQKLIDLYIEVKE